MCRGFKIGKKESTFHLRRENCSEFGQIWCDEEKTFSAEDQNRSSEEKITLSLGNFDIKRI